MREGVRLAERCVSTVVCWSTSLLHLGVRCRAQLVCYHLLLVRRQNGGSVEVPAYDFAIHKRVGIERTVSNVSVLFLDGIFTIACPEIR